MQIPIQDFMKEVVPDDGVRSVIINRKNTNKFKHKIFDNTDDFLQACVTLATPINNLYFAMGSFKQGFHDAGKKDANGNSVLSFRKQSNVKSLKSLWLDIDVGDDKPYKTQRQAIDATKLFIKETRLPVPWIVSSGSGGLHLYWAIDALISPDVWRQLAEQLHGATLQHGLGADPARTRDYASILRVPNSYNCKHEPAAHVEVLLRGKPHPLSLYEDRLRGYVVTRPASSKTDLSFLGIDSAMLGELGDMVGSVADVIPDVQEEFPTRSAEEIVAGCEQMRLQKDAEEPVWRGMLATLRHCEGGYDMSHKLSKQYPKYSKSETDNKIALLEEEDVPPYTCATFRGHRPEICERCPFNNQINSPISVKSSKIQTVEVADDGEVTKVAIIDELEDAEVDTVTKAKTKKAMDIPRIDAGIFKTDETGCYALRETADRSFWIKVYEYPVYPIQRVRGVTDDGDPCISYIFRRHHNRGKGYDDFQIPGDVLMGQGLITFLGSVGFLISARNKKDMAALMVDLVREVEADLEEVEVKNSLGWSDDFSAFLLGDKVYKDTGEVIDVRPKGKALEFSSLTVPRGFVEDWTKIANVYNRKGLEWGQVIVLSAFASPLMPIGALEKAALLFLTGEKGTGKSTALQLAVSVYGNPQRLMINKNDTAISRLEKLGILNNISAAFDEMTDMTPQEASAMAYQITQGRGKDRMSEGGKGLQMNTTRWSCLPIMSANDSMIESLARHSFDATAQMSRVLEIKAANFNEVYTDAERFQMEKLVRELPNNYGTAGDVYIRYLTTHKEEVKSLILKTEKLFVKHSGLDNSYRFWIYMCTRLIVGNMLARHLGLVGYNNKELFKYLVIQVKRAVMDIDRFQWSPDNLLSDFMHEHVGERLVVTEAKRPGDLKSEDTDTDFGYVLSKPIGTSDLSIRIEKKEQRAYITRHAIKEWCKRQGVPFNAFIDSIQKSGNLLSPKRRITLGKGTQFDVLGRTECIEVNLETMNVPQGDTDDD